MSNIVTRPHSRHAARFVPEEKRKRIQYDMDKRREEQGKTVIHLHEQPPKPICAMPTDSEMNDRLLAFFAEHGRAPVTMTIPFRWPWTEHGFAVQGLPPSEFDTSSPYLRRGRYCPVALVYNPDAEGISLA